MPCCGLKSHPTAAVIVDIVKQTLLFFSHVCIIGQAGASPPSCTTGTNFLVRVQYCKCCTYFFLHVIDEISHMYMYTHKNFYIPSYISFLFMRQRSVKYGEPVRVTKLSHGCDASTVRWDSTASSIMRHYRERGLFPAAVMLTARFSTSYIGLSMCVDV